MAVTRLKRKDRRNKAKAANRIERIRQLTRTPVIKNLNAPQEDVSSKEKEAASKAAVTAVEATAGEQDQQAAEATQEEE